MVSEHVQGWLKRLRWSVRPLALRYYLVGEYGPKTLRPHYHALVFGLPQDIAGGLDGEHGVVHDAWNCSDAGTGGFTFVGGVSEGSVKYVAGYVTSKIRVKEDVRLRGRYPEFARMSLRPGIGALVVADVAEGIVRTPGGLESVARNEDVPFAWKLGGKNFPVGRYLRRRLRGELGFGSLDAPKRSVEAYAQEMRGVFKEAFANSENTSKDLGQIVVDKNMQNLRNVEARFKIWESARCL